MLIAGQAAVKLAPDWALPANMSSNLDPNNNFAGLGDRVLIEPLNPGILTQPAWDRLFLTPNVIIPTREATEVFTPVPIRTQPPEVETPVKNPSPTVTATLGGPIIIPTLSPRRADLSITKTDSSNTYTPGTTVGYTIVVRNNGPDDAERFNIEDNIPANITSPTVNCSSTAGANCGVNASSGNIVSFRRAAVDVGDQITITVNGLVPSAATGNLSNTANIFIPADTLLSDSNGSNNSSTDTDTRFAISDLAITKSDGSNTYTATDPITYTIVVTNSGPSDALGVRVVDNIPEDNNNNPQFTSWNWSCTMTNASGCNGVTGSTTTFTDTGLNIQVGGRIEYTVTAYLPASAPTDTSSISNTARILLPGSPNFIDPNLSNNTFTDTDIPYIDLQITKSDQGAYYAPNGTLNYTVTLINNSSFDVNEIIVSDLFQTSEFSAWDWDCATPNPSCDGVNNSSSDFTDMIDLSAMSSLVYNVTADVSGTVGLGGITNMATVDAPTGLVDAVPGNNLATETTPPYIDLQITKTDGVTTYTPGGTLNYTVTVTNNSGFTLNGVTMTDTMPALVSSWSWSCTPNSPPPGATCDTASGTGDINHTVNLPAGTSVDFVITATVNAGAIENLINTASVSPPPGLVDVDTSNDSATETDVSAVGEPDVGSPDGNSYDIPAGTTAAFFLSQPIVANGNGAADFVFYEFPAAPGINLDHIIIEISSTGLPGDWLQVFNWGDGTADTNTNVDINLPNIANACTPASTEEDNCPIDSGDLYNNTGITINVDNSPLSAVPAGNYPWIRFTAPAGSGDAAQVDAIQILP
jgi:uncharacterized repeat protein (TIGR01451 family)